MILVASGAGILSFKSLNGSLGQDTTCQYVLSCQLLWEKLIFIFIFYLYIALKNCYFLVFVVHQKSFRLNIKKKCLKARSLLKSFEFDDTIELPVSFNFFSCSALCQLCPNILCFLFYLLFYLFFFLFFCCLFVKLRGNTSRKDSRI